MNINKYFNIAKEISKCSDYNKIHIGAILVYKNKVISMGFNTSKTHPLQKKYNKYRIVEGRIFDIESRINSIHAEMMCLINTKDMDIDWSKCSIFVYSELSNGNTRLTRPCGACLKALKDRGIKNIYYTTNNGYNYENLKKEVK